MEELAKITAREISECDERCFELLKLGRREHRRAGGVWSCGTAHDVGENRVVLEAPERKFFCSRSVFSALKSAFSLHSSFLERKGNADRPLCVLFALWILT